MSQEIKGFSDGHQFRSANRYMDTQKLFEQLGLSDEVENRTPTVGVNIAHLARMGSVQQLNQQVNGREISVSILGISTVEGPSDFQKLLKSLGAKRVITTAVDLSNGIFSDIESSKLDEIKCLLKDARDTGLVSESQDFNLRDHIGNCCPPDIDRQIDREASRILKPDGISIVNITTSDFLEESQGRIIVDFDRARDEFGEDVVNGLRTNIYDLKELKAAFPNLDVEVLRNLIIEIEPDRSFITFGEDEQGHGEWFRTLEDHQMTWANNGFNMVEISSRKGFDSHRPPLVCQRHNVVLKKVKNL